MSEKPWNGRFAEKTDRIVESFTASIAFDRRLYLYDIEGSIAHCRMLAKQSIITEDDASQIIAGLGRVARDIEHGNFELDASLEDIHMNIENRLTAEVGKVAQKLHTARSRNDQVALDIRMYLRDEVANILSRLTALRQSLVALAKRHIDVIMPGYTHLQRAQPVLFSHHLMAYYEMFTRDRARFKEVLKRINVMPLGSAALAGTTYPIDMAYTAKLLGFPEISSNSLDAVSARDFIMEFLAAASICMVHMSRLSEELILWSSAEFGFVEIPDAFATGSSIMPQKKNPDVAELVRGRAGRVFGNLMAVLTMMKGLPLSYNRDMQEDKEPLFDTVDTLKRCLEVYEKLIPRLKVNRVAMEKAASMGFLNATDMADYLVTKGMAFRDAHRCVGEVVRYAMDQNKELHELSLSDLKKFSRAFGEDIFEILTLQQMVNRRVSGGGTAKENVVKAMNKAQEALKLEVAENESDQKKKKTPR
ncbi:MAG: argininosuccinate lyase [Deltaproteobacteria bacterium]|nr:argininosuccinate lyase [Deltaproteobacteria bacterium]MBW2020432.1 argininosuccinate lyase [Deltaproteobacteria bacterium]MBW2075176.1 argininosuccinate lyase [Deltaproteobacteria bacterium]RLB81393.1 MAG: argininosuccinate lyase [Deltaproteobacteria bacterium]